MNRSFTADASGPTALVVRASTARIRIAVIRNLDRARVTVTTAGDDGPAAESVQRTTARTHPDRYEVTVPDIPQDHPGITVPGMPGVRFGRMTGVVGAVSNVVIVNGRVMSGSVIGTDDITVDVVVPAGSAAHVITVSGSVETVGFLRALAVNSTSGAVDAEAVREAIVNTMSGAVRIGHVDRGQAHIRTMSGAIDIPAYGGSYAELSTMSGAITLAAVPTAAGVVDASTMSGAITTHNTRHLDVRAGSTSGATRLG